jgi:hypothetical protein
MPTPEAMPHPPNPIRTIVVRIVKRSRSPVLLLVEIAICIASAPKNNARKPTIKTIRAEKIIPAVRIIWLPCPNFTKTHTISQKPSRGPVSAFFG